MSEFEELLNSVEEVKVGDVVQGQVLSIESDQATVSIVGTGVEGVLTLRELTNDKEADINDFIKVGDELELLVIRPIVEKDSGSAGFLLSKKRLEARKAWDELVGKEGELLKVKVIKAVKGGLSVQYGEVRGFIPASLVDDHFISDFSTYVGQEFDAKIIEINPADNRFILSRRAIVETEKAAAREVAYETLEEGTVVEGTVARLTNFGAFVNLGSVDGLIHISEISHTHINRPQEVLSVGDKVNVQILSINKEEGRISLSLKATVPGPWDDIEEKAPVGAVLDGVVKRLTTFGAFVELFPGVEGLVHISQISHNHIGTPQEVLSPDQEVKVKVLEVNPTDRRIALSIKALEERPQAEKEKVVEEENTYELPEEQTGFSIGDLTGEE
ncbi:MAG: 30S ribosomal protein S1 [Streptococcaceae bacterium]|jgi:small subunit ribosomal protein S1|nr:30S ribosomal protein S1 [Streptococcaceae bacterium]MCH4175963.1 30S ribosomal protein S1 [Streptococcaceae bacterium]